MPQRRKRGSGYVATHPRADGLWPGGVTLPDGKRKRLYGKTQAELQKKVDVELRKIAEGRPGQTRDALVGAYLTDWLDRRRRTRKGLAPSTVVTYEALIRLHVVPTLGQRRVSSVTVRDLERLYDRLREAGLSESTIHRVHSLLHTAFKDAERRGEILRNPCDLLDAPADAPRPKQPLDLDHVVRYLQAAIGDEYEALWITVAETGLRQGELFALRRTDVDLDGGTLDVPEKVRRLPGQGMVRSRPKTASGDRRMALGGWAVAVLRSHLARQSDRPNPLGLLWPNRAGGHLEPQNWNRRVWRPFLKKAGLDEAIQFRELTRKVHASVAVAAGVDPATLGGRMGHADPETTLGWYVKTIGEADRQAAKRIDRALRTLAQRKPKGTG